VPRPATLPTFPATPASAVPSRTTMPTLAAMFRLGRTGKCTMFGGWTMSAYFFRSEPGAAELRRLARRESGRVC
jgi:hypothetical protein